MEVIGLLSGQPIFIFLGVLVFSGVKVYELRLKYKTQEKRERTVLSHVVKLAADFKIDRAFVIRHYEKYYSITDEYAGNGYREIAGDWQEHNYDEFADWAIKKMKSEGVIIIHKKEDCDFQMLIELMSFYELESCYIFPIFKEEKLIASLNCYFSGEKGFAPQQLAVMQSKVATLQNEL